MSEHHAAIRWSRQTPDFKYETYDRTHSVEFGGGSRCSASSAAEFLGKKELVNPEEMLVAALSSCHMLTFLAIAARSRLVLDEYKDAAVGYLEKNADGKLAVTRVVLRPFTRFSGEVPSAQKVKEMHEKAHANCFIAQSVRTEVSCEPA